MNKVKLCGFTIACIIGLFFISPITTFAAETNTETANLSDQNNNQKKNRAAFEEKMRKANEKWKTLTAQQKNEVYSLMEDDMKEKTILMDKLVEFGVMEKADVVMIKARMQEKFNTVKKSGEFPLFRHNGRKSRK